MYYNSVVLIGEVTSMVISKTQNDVPACSIVLSTTDKFGFVPVRVNAYGNLINSQDVFSFVKGDYVFVEGELMMRKLRGGTDIRFSIEVRAKTIYKIKGVNDVKKDETDEKRDGAGEQSAQTDSIGDSNDRAE